MPRNEQVEPPLPEIVGSATAMQDVYRLVRLAAPRAASVLLVGETGTGKELDREGRPQAEPAFGRPVHPRQLRGAAREPARKRAVRPRQGRVHRGRREQDRPLRGRPRRHHLPRRDQQHLAQAPGEAAARAAGARVRARRREPHDPRRCARHRRDQRLARRPRRRGRVPRGPVLPPQRGPDLAAAAARAARGHPAPGPVLPPPLRRAAQVRRARADAARARRAEGARLAGQRPRAGEHAGAADRALRRRADHAGTAAVHAPAVRPAHPRRGTQASRSGPTCRR